jgi:hypothetical protein
MENSTILSSEKKWSYAITQSIDLLLVNEEADKYEIDTATLALRRELSNVEGCEVRHLKNPVPDGAKGDASALGQFIIDATGKNGIGLYFLYILRDWLLRNQGFTVEIKWGKFSFKLSGKNENELNKSFQEIEALPIIER